MKQNNRTTKSVDGILKRNLISVHNKSTLGYSSFKLASVFVLATLLTFSLLSVGGTISYYRDREVSPLNKFLAGSLAFDVLIEGQESAQTDLTSTEQVVVPIMTPHPDSVPIQYSVVSQMAGGDGSMCKEIHMFSTFPFPYDNKLLLLSTGLTEDVGAWSSTFSLPDSSLFPNTSCTVDLIYSGYHADASFGDGYSDVQKVSITFNVTENLELQARFSSFVEDAQTETVEEVLVVEEVEKVDEETKEEKKVEEVLEVVEVAEETQVPEILPEA